MKLSTKSRNWEQNLRIFDRSIPQVLQLNLLKRLVHESKTEQMQFKRYYKYEIVFSEELIFFYKICMPSSSLDVSLFK